MVTCLMTYWYPGAFETIRAIRRIYPHVPVVLGITPLCAMIMPAGIPAQTMC
ncbi:MAG: hypothetical protein R2860_11645 [Desulfobacterales bacterium]